MVKNSTCIIIVSIGHKCELWLIGVLFLGSHKTAIRLGPFSNSLGFLAVNLCVAIESVVACFFKDIKGDKA